MPDLMARAAEFIAGKLAASVSRPVTYVRGNDSVVLDATVGRSSFDVDDGHGVMRFETRDYVVRMDALVLGGTATLPRRGDRVLEEMGDGNTVAYEVINVAGSPEWRPCDSSRVLIRIHTKLAGTA
jgi:hypothetical protein